MPLPLPRFTFLCGPHSKTGLAGAIARTNPDLYIENLYYSIHESARALFWFDGPFDTDAQLPGSKMSMGAWARLTEDHLRDCIGPSALGHLAVNIGATTNFQFWPRVLVVDVQNLNDILPFIPLFPPTERGLCVHLGAIPAKIPVHAALAHVWIAVPEAAAQLEMLEIELRTLNLQREPPTCAKPSSTPSSLVSPPSGSLSSPSPSD